MGEWFKNNSWGIFVFCAALIGGLITDKIYIYTKMSVYEETVKKLPAIEENLILVKENMIRQESDDDWVKALIESNTEALNRVADGLQDLEKSQRSGEIIQNEVIRRVTKIEKKLNL